MRELYRRRAVVFDVDGTLVDLKVDKNTYNRVVSEMINYAINLEMPIHVIPEKASISSLWRSILSWCWLHRRDSILTIMKSLNTIILKAEQKWATNVKPIDKTIALLKKLIEGGSSILGIFTIGSHKATALKLRRVGLNHSIFRAIVSRELVLFRIKPDPYHLAVTLRMMNIKPEEAIVVGDSKADMFSAESLGCEYIDVSSLIQR